MAFAPAYQMQTRAARRLLEEVDSHGGAVTGNTVFIVEHDPVYTVGIRSKDYRGEIEEKLRRLGADFVRTNRGGLITFHGPGQLVAYPVLHLGSFFRDKSMRRYVCSLEKMIIDVCARFQLEAKTTEHTGVWIGDNKIAAIGKLPFITLFPFPLSVYLQTAAAPQYTHKFVRWSFWPSSCTKCQPMWCLRGPS